MTGVMPAIGTPLSRDKLLETARSLPADLEVLSTLGEMLQDVNAELEAIASSCGVISRWPLALSG